MKEIKSVLYIDNKKNLYNAENGEIVGTISEAIPKIVDGAAKTVKEDTVKGPRKKHVTEVYYIIGMDHIAKDIIVLLQSNKYKDVTKEQKMKLAKGEITYIVSYNDSHAIFIRLKNFSGKEVIIYNADTIVRTCEQMEPRRVYELVKRLSQFGAKSTISGKAVEVWEARMEQSGRSTQWKNERRIKIGDGETLEDYSRRSYFGGWCYCNAPLYKDMGEMLRLDVHSLYPSILSAGVPSTTYAYRVKSEEELKEESSVDRTTYLIHFTARFKLKKGFPFVCFNTGKMRMNNQKSSCYTLFGKTYDSPVDMYMWEDEFELFRELYKVMDFRFIDAVVFPLSDPLYDYVLPLYNGKQTAKTAGDYDLSDIYKMLMNSLIGGMARKSESYITLIDKNHETCYKIETAPTSYVSIASYITSEGRTRLARAAAAHADRFLYCDTDSLHLRGWGIPEDMKNEIGSGLGMFGIEGKPEHAVFYGQKKYIEYGPDGQKVVFAGCPKKYTDFLAEYLRDKDIGTYMMDGLSTPRIRDWADSVERFLAGDAAALAIPYRVDSCSTWLWYYPYKDSSLEYREEKKQKERLSFFGLLDHFKRIKSIVTT